jgi:6-pyruvoyltetrahydropterin/6-carboxytetrahydropterin synthase
MSMIRLTKKFHFEMAHALWNYDGSCRNIHGHSYKLYVTVIGEAVKDKNDPKYGMVVDFSVLKKLIKSLITDELDHSFLISSDADVKNLENVDQMFDKMKVVDFQPTCENMIVWISDIIKIHLPVKLKLHSLKLCETPTSYAEWYAADQL